VGEHHYDVIVREKEEKKVKEIEKINMEMRS